MQSRHIFSSLDAEKNCTLSIKVAGEQRLYEVAFRKTGKQLTIVVQRRKDAVQLEHLYFGNIRNHLEGLEGIVA